MPCLPPSPTIISRCTITPSHKSTLEDSPAVLKFPDGAPKVTFDVNAPLWERIFHFSTASILKLKAKANSWRDNGDIDGVELIGKQGNDTWKNEKQNGNGKITSVLENWLMNVVSLSQNQESEVKDPTVQISSFQSLCAQLWRSVTCARKLPPSKMTTFRMADNCRHRIEPRIHPLYFGNAIQSIPTVAMFQFQEEERRQSGKNMQIFVKTMNGNSVTLEVESSTTLANLKHQIIENNVGSPQIKWNLFFAGTLLEETKTLSDYNIQGSSLLHMAFELKEDALLCVRTLDNEPDFEVKIGTFDTLNDLKAKIYDRNGYPQNYQRFIFGDTTQLNNGVIIDQMDIIQTELLSFGDLGSISSDDGFQPLLYFIPRMT